MRAATLAACAACLAAGLCGCLADEEQPGRAYRYWVEAPSGGQTVGQELPPLSLVPRVVFWTRPVTVDPPDGGPIFETVRVRTWDSPTGPLADYAFRDLELEDRRVEPDGTWSWSARLEDVPPHAPGRTRRPSLVLQVGHLYLASPAPAATTLWAETDVNDALVGVKPWRDAWAAGLVRCYRQRAGGPLEAYPCFRDGVELAPRLDLVFTR